MDISVLTGQIKYRNIKDTDACFFSSTIVPFSPWLVKWHVLEIISIITQYNNIIFCMLNFLRYMWLVAVVLTLRALGTTVNVSNLLLYIMTLNYSYLKRKLCLNIKICKCLVSIFHKKWVIFVHVTLSDTTFSGLKYRCVMYCFKHVKGLKLLYFYYYNIFNFCCSAEPS